MSAQIIRKGERPEFYTDERCYIRELFNESRHPGFSVAQARVSVGEITAWHALVETDELYYILTGTGLMEIDNRSLGEIQAGDSVFIPAGSAQRIRNTGTEDLIFLCICQPGFQVDKYQDLENK